jgi:adenylate kinase
VALEVDEDELVRRLLARAEIEGRSDDNEETIRNRMRVYRSQTEPLVAYYRERGLLRPVPGLGSVDQVEKRIEEALSR